MRTARFAATLESPQHSGHLVLKSLLLLLLLRNSNSIQLEVDGKHLIKPNDVADEFAKHFQSVYSNPCPIVFPTLLPSSECLPLASVSDSDVKNAIKRLRPSKSVGIDDIPGFIIKGCTDIFVPVLKHIFNLSLSQQHFPTLWKQAVLKKGKCSSVSNYRPISLLCNFSKIFEFVIHEHVSHFHRASNSLSVEDVSSCV
jgi:hypothetical protein